MPRSKHRIDPLTMVETFIMYDLQWLAHDGLTVHTVLHPVSRSLADVGDVLTCGTIRQGGGRWLELKRGELRQVTCLLCLGRGGTTK